MVNDVFIIFFLILAVNLTTRILLLRISSFLAFSIGLNLGLIGFFQNSKYKFNIQNNKIVNEISKNENLKGINQNIVRNIEENIIMVMVVITIIIVTITIIMMIIVGVRDIQMKLSQQNLL